MGSHIFRILGVRKLGYCRDMKIESLHHIKFNKLTNVSVHFRMTKLKVFIG